MQFNADLCVLPLAIERNGQLTVFNASLLLDATHGPTLVDTGLPAQFATVVAALAEAGVQVTDLRRIIISHQDIDHVGCLHELVQASGARVLASTVEAPFIDGSELPRFARPEILAQRPELRSVAAQFQPSAVDELLEDNTQLDLAGGVRVIFSPGHTPGHICLYLERTRTLLAGDALTSDNGQLHGPNSSATPDMAQAALSVQKLAALDLAAIVCYHGGVVDNDANGQIRRVVEELAASQ